MSFEGVFYFAEERVVEGGGSVVACDGEELSFWAEFEVVDGVTMALEFAEDFPGLGVEETNGFVDGACGEHGTIGGVCDGGGPSGVP